MIVSGKAISCNLSQVLNVYAGIDVNFVAFVKSTLSSHPLPNADIDDVAPGIEVRLQPSSAIIESHKTE